MDNSELIKKHLLETMKCFHEFCDEHGLKYYLLGGTLLGAVRHKGFIPWDDDIDVAMPREDYEKLLLLKSEVSREFSLNAIEHTPGYIYPFAKFCNPNLVVEEPFYKPFVTGVWIDIFPLDYTFKSVFAQNIQFSIIKLLRMVLILKTFSFKLSNRSNFAGKGALFFGHLAQVFSKDFLYKLMKFIQIKLPGKFSKKNNVANFHGTWGVKETAPKTLFDDRVLYDFEGCKFWSVKDSDYWLTKVYGDYMQLPPEEKRVSAHIGKIRKVIVK